MTWWTPYRRNRHKILFNLFVVEMFGDEQKSIKSNKRSDGVSKRGLVRTKFLQKMKEQKERDP
jgi:hypothetical protein